MRYLTTLRTFALAAPAVAALSFTAVAQDIDETYWYASGDPTVPDGQLWVTGYGECWQSAVPDGPTNLPPCQVEPPLPPLVLGLRFNLDKYTLDQLQNPEELTELDRFIDQVQETKREEQLVVAGFTDKLGSFEHNQVLSENRANTVRDYMIDRGIPADQVRAAGFAWEDAQGYDTNQYGPLENNPLRRRVVVVDQTTADDLRRD